MTLTYLQALRHIIGGYAGSAAKRTRLHISLTCLALSLIAHPAWSALETIASPQRLCIYYGWPSHVNGSNGDVAQATAHFMNCDVIVLGDGIGRPEHADHLRSAQIVTALVSEGRRVFGYVDLGVTTQNLDEGTLRQRVDGWRDIGATGIFFDDAGYDFGVTRARQNTMVEYVHQLGLSVFVNAWNIDDVLGDLNEEQQTNPARLGAGDWYLAESWLVGAGAYQPLAQWVRKAETVLHYSRVKGISIAAVSTTAANKASMSDGSSSAFKLGWWGAAMYNIAAWQWSDVTYGAGNDKLWWHETNRLNYGLQFFEDRVYHSDDAVVHSRATDAGRIYLFGDGMNEGTALFHRNAASPLAIP